MGNPYAQLLLLESCTMNNYLYNQKIVILWPGGSSRRGSLVRCLGKK